MYVCTDRGPRARGLCWRSLMPTKPVVTWSQLKSPTNAEQRIAFLDACQRQFETVRAVGPVSGALLVGPPVAGAAPSSFTALDNVSTPVGSALCALCARGASESGLVANPFSDWVVVLCPACMP